jgi:flagellar basal body-associated protein FliL
MRKILVVLLVMAVLALSGCVSWMDGSYVSVTPYEGPSPQEDQKMLSASDYLQLRNVMVEMVESGRESGLISVSGMEQNLITHYMNQVITHVTRENPIGAYAVDQISYELGTTSGQNALAVSITYNHNRAEIRRIKECDSMEAVSKQIALALNNCEAGVVLLINSYRETDFTQNVRDYADDYPEFVMELPQVTVNMYPEKGSVRLVELQFTYQTSRESLRDMQNRVKPLFDSARLYVSGDASETEKYAQLYAFLMERATYEIQTSITPSYSLLHHGVGDSRAFAVVYAAMCRWAGLDCMVVSGTVDGEPRFWNIICCDGANYHLDLLRCNEQGQINICADDQMQGYVWDYSAYPACGTAIISEE